MTDATRKIGRFCLWFAPQILIAPLVLFLFVTFLHELAHAAMALTLGGEVTEFHFLPTAEHLGVMRWNPPDDAPVYFGDLVRIAPYLMWSGFALAVIIFSATPQKVHPLVASTIFMWGYVAPVGDIGWNLLSPTGDLGAGSGGAQVIVILAASPLLLGAYFIGYYVQRRLFADNAVGMRGYILSSGIIGALMGVAAIAGLFILR